jgi:hypothetical protein
VRNEDALQYACIQALNNRKEVFAFHIQNEGKRSPQQASRAIALGLRAGIPDLCLLCSDGRTRWIELKTDSGKLSTAQMRFRDLCNEWGHDWALVRSVEELHAILDKWL